MKIGIKYCGGCQSKFNRPKLLEDIKNHFKDFTFEYVKDEEKYDLLIVISGCHIRCARTDYNYDSIVHLDNFNYQSYAEILEEEFKNFK